MAIYYCSTIGDDDTGDGSIGSPWATWHKLGNSLSAGDTGYIRGGTYTTFTYGAQFQCRWNGLSGTSIAPINIFAYPGEVPIWDFSGFVFANNVPYILQMNQCDYVHIKGLRITNCAQPHTLPDVTDGSPIFAFNLVNSQHCTIETLTVDHIGGFGISCGAEGWGAGDANTETSNYNLFLNCDAYDLADPYSPSPYDGSNGINITWNGVLEDGNPWFPNTTFRGCRAWYCSDDGFETFAANSHPVYYENCWSFWNGYVNHAPHEVAIGVGWKLGPMPDTSCNDIVVATLTNCIAAQNTHSGFSGNYCYDFNGTWGYARYNMYNCIAYNNSHPSTPGGGLGIWFTWNADAENPQCTIRNCISIYNADTDEYWTQTNDSHGGEWIESNNSWNYDGGPFTPYIGLSISQCNDLNNFVSLDVSQLAGARQADGSLPIITFGHLVEDSPLIGAGIAIAGLTLDGEGKTYLNPPSIGPFEYGVSYAGAIDSVSVNHLAFGGAHIGQTGKLTRAYNFTTNDYIGDLTARVSALELTSAISISAWFKTNISDSAYHTIVSNYSADYGYALSMNSSYQIEWLVGNGTSTGVKTTSSTYNDNAWHHVVATFDGTNVLLYIDGVLVGGVPATWNNNIAYNADCRYIVGARNNAGSGERYWEGYLDEIAVYNRELQLGDAEDLYNSGIGVTYPFY